VNGNQVQPAPDFERQKPKTGRSILVWSGRTLMFAGLTFVGFRCWSYRHSVEEQLADPVFLFTTLLFSVLYAASCLLLAFGWWSSLHSRGECRMRWRTAWTIYGRTQIAKYVPGNIFHFAGRHLLSANEGISHSQLLMAASLEIIMMLLAAGVISSLAFSRVIEWLRASDYYFLVAIGIGVGLIGSVALLYLACRIHNRLPRLRWERLFAAQASYLFFFLISTLLFFALLKLGQSNLSSSNWPAVFGSYAVAWTIGFVIPGAPGGLGVREAVLLALLSGLLPEKSQLVSVLMFRVVTTLGDILFFFGSTGLRLSAK
jgi:uncharacterized membrane protein YbhN (UPF0104 family)